MEWGGVFNVARYLTDSLRGPVLKPYDEARSAEFHVVVNPNGEQNLEICFF